MIIYLDDGLALWVLCSKENYKGKTDQTIYLTHKQGLFNKDGANIRRYESPNR